MQNSRTLAAAVDLKDHTTFNTLSNVYATAIDRSTPVKERDDSWSSSLTAKPSLRLQTQDPRDAKLRTPYLGPYLDTPDTAHPDSPAVARADVIFPSSIAMTATPPLSATTASDTGARVFTFDARVTPPDAAGSKTPVTPRTSKRRSTAPASWLAPPYTHPRALHSILRNSPLPALNTRSPVSPRRQSVRLQEKAARRVAYNSPLCQTITTSKYIRSHIDLLSEDASPATPATPSSAEDPPQSVLDATMAYTGNETRDGGQTPGPFEEMRRRMAGLTPSSPVLSAGGGIRKKGKKREKKRRWVWTIGEAAGEEQLLSPEIAKQDVQQTPKPILPALGLPSPGPRTRSQTTEAVDRPIVPVLALPVPKPRSGARPAAFVPAAPQPTAVAPAAPAPPPRPQRRLTLEIPAPVLPPSPVPRSQEFASPINAVLAVEPPTPSVGSTMSQDSVFEARPDEDMDMMSDTSSVMSLDDGLGVYERKRRDSGDQDEDVDMDMDMDTPKASEVPLIGRVEFWGV